MDITLDMTLATFPFIPVSVNKGRKFRGDAYDVGAGEQISSSNWAYTSWSTRLWCPAENRYVYANPDFIERREVPSEQIEADKRAYVEHAVIGTITWCQQQRPSASDSETVAFARNILKKRHPDMLKMFDAATANARMAAADVLETLNWAETLTTRPMRMCGRNCPGGKPLSAKRKVEIAYSSCKKKGLTTLSDFHDAWVLGLTLHNWTKYENICNQ